jgi:hypothetical protein
MKIRLALLELQTDMVKLIPIFLQLLVKNMPKICTEASENHLSKHVHKRLSVP